MFETPSSTADSLIADPALLEKYALSGPRYTSYPSADRFGADLRPADALREMTRRAEERRSSPVSLYVHLPFCDTVCYYCACNKVVTRDRRRAGEYLGYLEREIATQRGALGRDEEVIQMHWGGGTPTFLSPTEMTGLTEALRRYFVFLPEGEYSIEADPRRLEPGTIEHLAALGFNRISLGVQDFDPVVQQKVNRVQSAEETGRVVGAARASGFRSVNFDLIYGLPGQSAASVARTLETVLGMRPDRIALYNYAHLPQLFPPQRRIATADLPPPAEKIRILALAIEQLAAAGYVYIGMDHFALPGDDLALAQARGDLQRNFQGYSTHARCDLLAFGVSAIAALGDIYAQNHRALEQYYACLDRGELPVFRGHRLGADDRIRREVIQQLTCRFRLVPSEYSERFGVEFWRYFAAERERLEELARDGLIEIADDAIAVTPRGRLLVRVVCMVFDRYLRQAQSGPGYSRTI